MRAKGCRDGEGARGRGTARGDDREEEVDSHGGGTQQAAYKHAIDLINQGKVVFDERDDWSEAQPSAEKENEFIRLHGFDVYGKWHLGIDSDEPEDTKARYKFPYGNFENVHRRGVLAAESRAGQYKYHDIANAAAHLHGMIEQMMKQHAGRSG